MRHFRLQAFRFVSRALRQFRLQAFRIVSREHLVYGDLDRLRRTRHQTTQGRRRGGGADAQGETREGAGCC